MTLNCVKDKLQTELHHGILTITTVARSKPEPFLWLPLALISILMINYLLAVSGCFLFLLVNLIYSTVTVLLRPRLSCRLGVDKLSYGIRMTHTYVHKQYRTYTYTYTMTGTRCVVKICLSLFFRFPFGSNANFVLRQLVVKRKPKTEEVLMIHISYYYRTLLQHTYTCCALCWSPCKIVPTLSRWERLNSIR